MLWLVFISPFGYTKKVKYKTSTTSEEALKPIIVSSLKCACLSVCCNNSSIWIQSNRLISLFINLPPRALKCCFIKSTSWHVLLVLVVRTLYPLLDPIWSLMDYWAEMSYLLCMKELCMNFVKQSITALPDSLEECIGFCLICIPDQSIDCRCWEDCIKKALQKKRTTYFPPTITHVHIHTQFECNQNNKNIVSLSHFEPDYSIL